MCRSRVSGLNGPLASARALTALLSDAPGGADSHPRYAGRVRMHATEATKVTEAVASVLGQVDDEKDERCDDGEDRCEEQALA